MGVRKQKNNSYENNSYFWIYQLKYKFEVFSSY